PLGSDAYVLMREVAEVVERHSDTLRLSVRATTDASQNIALLNSGEIDTAVIRSDTPVVSDIRVIADLYPDMMQLIALDETGVSSVNDLQNVSVSVPPFGTDSFRSFWVLGDHYDLPIDAMRWNAEPFQNGADRLLNREVDALFTIRSLRDAQLIRLFEDAQLKGMRLRIVPIRQAAAIAVKRPFLEAAEIPAGTYTGATPVPRRDVPTSSVDRILVSRDNISTDAIRELTRILFEHRLDLTIRFSLASAITQPDQARGLSVPLHDGAEAFYLRDEPSFIQENAEPLALLVTVATVLVSGLFALRSRLTAGQKNRADVYNYQVLDIQKRALLEDDIDELHGLKVELTDVLRTIVIALDTDDVTDEGFQSFSILLEAVRETINDRIRQLS
ncbi:MAG: TAXI family TRAP transporter solute-binding subunit, partial [Pseudomonadota bacterium]